MHLEASRTAENLAETNFPVTIEAVTLDVFIVGGLHVHSVL
jgi:hypothetical protein